MQYQHLFFDWDHTLWDFETNSNRSLESLYYHFDLRRFGVNSPQHFIDVYQPINYKLWREFREGKIDAKTVKIKRFQDSLKQFSVLDNGLISQIKSYYLDQLPLGGNLMPNVEESLALLHKHYQIHVVTNGFLEVTQRKIEYSTIGHYFTSVLSAEEVGVLKPNVAVFNAALKRAGANIDQSLFIGDNLIADVQGPKAIGMDQVYYNPENEPHQEQPTYEIQDMMELVGLLSSKAVRQEQ